MNLTIKVSNPTVKEAETLTKEDVFGKFNPVTYEKISNGMMVARGYGSTSKYFTQEDKNKLVALLPERCPIWGDTLPYKSVTVICGVEQFQEVIYWLEYVLGGNCVSKTQNLGNGQAAIRADYKCW